MIQIINQNFRKIVFTLFNDSYSKIKEIKDYYTEIMVDFFNLKKEVSLAIVVKKIFFVKLMPLMEIYSISIFLKKSILF